METYHMASVDRQTIQNLIDRLVVEASNAPHELDADSYYLGVIRAVTELENLIKDNLSDAHDEPYYTNLP